MNIKINKPFNFAFPIYFIAALYFGFQGYVSWYILALFFLHDLKLTFEKKNKIENINR